MLDNTDDSLRAYEFPEETNGVAQTEQEHKGTAQWPATKLNGAHWVPLPGQRGASDSAARLYRHGQEQAQPLWQPQSAQPSAPADLEVTLVNGTRLPVTSAEPTELDDDPAQTNATAQEESEEPASPGAADTGENTGSLDRLRPARKSGRFGRLLRVLTGTYEDYLDWIPSERARYSALAAVMLGTASFSGMAMYFALSEILGSGRFWFVLIALGWASFVLSLDRWLVASSSGARFLTRAKTVLPRLIIACIIGLTISEPLILLIFQASITQTVSANRANAISQLTNDYTACNPVPGTVPPPPAPTAADDCADHTLVIPANPGAHAQQISNLQNAVTTLQNTITQESSTLAGLQQTVNNECNGVSVPGVTTGHVGDGPACHQDQAAVNTYEGDHPIVTQQDTLAEDNSEIAADQAQETKDKTSFQQTLTQDITHKQNQLPQPDAPIGLGDRYDALLSLSASVAVIGVTSWVLRLFFIVIDCLPVFLKFVGGAAPYDYLADQKTASAQRIFAQSLENEERKADVRLETELHNVQIEEEDKRSQAAITQRNAAIETERRQQYEVDRLWQIKLDRRRQAHRAADDGQSPSGSGRHLPTETDDGSAEFSD